MKQQHLNNTTWSTGIVNYCHIAHLASDLELNLLLPHPFLINKLHAPHDISLGKEQHLACHNKQLWKKQKHHEVTAYLLFTALRNQFNIRQLLTLFATISERLIEKYFLLAFHRSKPALKQGVKHVYSQSYPISEEQNAFCSWEETPKFPVARTTYYQGTFDFLLQGPI